MKYLVVIALATLVSACDNAAPKQQVDPEALFVHEVVPIFASKCMGCHGDKADKIEGGLDLSDYQNLLVGGNTGKPSIIPGKPDKSILYQAVLRTEEELAMPPKEGDKLSDTDIQIIYDWIAGGAPWPDQERRAEIQKDTSWQYGNRLRVNTSGGLSETWDNRPYQKDNLWAYYPVQDYEVPWGEFDPDHSNPIDAFLAEKRQQAGLESAPTASKTLLLRRATIDLTGLPPTPEEMKAFLQDQDQEAFKNVIDRLLSSPHYGEQWARHWLDVVRYADSGGFSNDFIRPNAWRYRDYVVRAFNEDKPYNRFAMEQIAGDEIDPDDPEMLIATGFLRMGPWEHTAMSVAAETRQYYLDDVTNIVGETFLAAPLNCAKCHDHKYDPIPTKDYYKVQSVFATTQFAEREAPFLEEENTSITDYERERIANWIEDTEAEQQRLKEKEEKAAREWYRERGLTYLPKRERRKLPEDQQPPRYLGLTFDDLGYRKVLQKRVQLLERRQERYEPLAFSVYNGPVKVQNSRNRMTIEANLQKPAPKSFILGGGSVYAPLEEVQPGVLSVFADFSENIDPEIIEIPTNMYNRRLEFAQWLTHPDNPVFARSMVNRIWQYHFGKGIVETPNNFGTTGGKPTHPELLDWLTNYFIEHNWSVKAMHRLIMSSEAYQLSSEHPDWEQVNQADSDNEWLTYFNPRRMHAEEMKDAMLYISGELNPELGGFPVRPEINIEVALQPRHTMGSIAPAYQPSRTPAERNRRTIYAERYRNLIDPDQEVFNKPGSEMSCERRSESTVTPQVFTLFNGNNTRLRALAFANSLKKEFSSAEERVKEAVEWIYNREANRTEIEESLQYLEKMKAYHQENKPPDTKYPTSVKREMFEEMTGESFSYVEELLVYKDYVPDLQPTDVDASTRALADLITVFFNSNEFVYVY